MKRFLLIVLIFTWPLSAAAAGDDLAFLVPYDALLKRYVSKEEKEGIRTALVDYEGWGTDRRHQEAMMLLGRAHPARLAGKEALAFWMNAYNLLTIDLIITHKETESIKHIGSWLTDPWKDYRWRMGEMSYSLDEIEHAILRPMGEPRIHMAIVCASLSCPDLRAEAYMAADLDRQLDDQVSTFLKNRDKGLRLTPSGVELSKIFKWYADDFTRGGGVIAFIRGYIPEIRQNAVIAGYLDYNWSLNSKP